jgi:transposase
MSQDDLNVLPDDINQLKQLVMSVRSELVIQNKANADNSKTIQDTSKMIQDSRSEIVRLNEIIKLFQGKIFGKSSEKSPDQAELFDEAEVESLSPDDLTAYATEEVEVDPIEAPIKPKEKSGRKPLPKELERIVVEHDLSDNEKICDCGCQKLHIGDNVSEQLDIIPAVIQVIQHRRKKYACKACEGKIQVAALPP